MSQLFALFPIIVFRKKKKIIPKGLGPKFFFIVLLEIPFHLLGKSTCQLNILKLHHISKCLKIHIPVEAHWLSPFSSSF